MSTYFMMGLECDKCGKSEVVRAAYVPPHAVECEGERSLVVGGPPVPELPEGWGFLESGDMSCGCSC